MISHIIFDCDGVLIDSEKLSMDVDIALLAENGINLSETEIHRFVGTTFEAMVVELQREYKRPLPPDLATRKDGMMLDLYRRDLKPVPGVISMLKKLALPKSIGTNGPRERATEALRMTGLEIFFGDRLTTYEDVKNGKPAPDIYLLAAQRAGLAPARCLVVEDSVTGVTSALAAGCKVIGFTGVAYDPAAKARELNRLGVSRVIQDMGELLDAISPITLDLLHCSVHMLTTFSATKKNNVR
jgi:HAD superfamily hydrolase (TIGR01509 family)